jgi:putative ABC transport system ATP-binding protein
VTPEPVAELLVAEEISVCLQLRDGSSRFELVDVALSLAAGSVTAVVGESGSGKSTLLQVLGLLSRPASGRLRLLDHDVTESSDAARARLRSTAIGFLFQSFNLVPQLNALDNVLLAAAGPRREARREALALLYGLGLGHRLRNHPGELSAGEQQRVACARAMVNGAAVILADEPTGNLDGNNERALIDRLRTYAEAGNAILLVTHSDAVAARADVVRRMSRGRLS